ncbi:BrxA/BrxB family bacilliredoxin [Bacteroidota bacterium]
MYPEEFVAPMRVELTNAGFMEFKSANEVTDHLTEHKGTSLMVINSVCGCAAGSARPGVLRAIQQSQKTPDNLVTVFAGVDQDATSKAREYAMPYPPSSPSIGLFKDGELVHFVERHHIEGRPADMISDHLVDVFEEYC